jgi:hypothetical protein
MIVKQPMNLEDSEGGIYGVSEILSWYMPGYNKDYHKCPKPE